jgi:3-oxoacyl-[acyl-carrier protein] reductase
MDLGLKGKTVLITGASKGIGRAAARIFVEEGCNVGLVSRTEADLNAIKGELQKTASVRVDTFAVDLSKSANIQALAKDFPDVDILVNNAGAIPGGTLLQLEESAWRAAWDLKVYGYVNMCRSYYSLMKKRGHGVIINVIGTAAITRDPAYICGVMGNAALSALSQSLGSDSYKDNIRVLAVSPGPVSTERLVTLMRKKAKDELGDADRWEDFLKGFPYQRAATPEEVAAAIVFTASAKSSYTSGSVVAIDGGKSGRAN